MSQILQSVFKSKISPGLKNIWRYTEFYPPIKKENRLTLGEGNTPEIFVPKIAKELGLKELIFKREDLNPNGSHKDRLLAYQISRARENREKVLIISSSGNAAVSAAAYCKLSGIRLFAFVSPKTGKEKISAIANAGACVIISRYALTLADLAAKKFGIKNLRPGADENSCYGLRSIAFEIFEHCGKIGAIFVPTSSASTLLAVNEAYGNLIESEELDKMPEIYTVQTAKIHPIAGYFDKDFAAEKESLARGIVSKSIPRKKLRKILGIIRKSGGGGAVVSDKEIKGAQETLRQSDIETGYESAAAFAGAIKLKERIRGKKVVILLTGKKQGGIMKNIRSENIFKADNTSETERIIINRKSQAFV